MTALFLASMPLAISAGVFGVAFLGSAVALCAASNGGEVDPYWAGAVFVALPVSATWLRHSLRRVFVLMAPSSAMSYPQKSWKSLCTK